jgi:hypothetical protein
LVNITDVILDLSSRSYIKQLEEVFNLSNLSLSRNEILMKDWRKNMKFDGLNENMNQNASFSELTLHRHPLSIKIQKRLFCDKQSQKVDLRIE